MTALLTVDGVDAGYQDVSVLHAVSLTAAEGEVVAVVGANGAGKSTLLKAISGLIPCSRGTVHFAGADLTPLKAHDIVGHRLVMVPEGGRLFGFSTVEENLELGAFNPTARPATKASLEEVFEIFPILAERRKQLAGSLSGGERSMCALGRALMSRPRLLMLDEPSLGLSPRMVERIFEVVASLAARMEITIVLVEQNVSEALALADRGYVLERGHIVQSGRGADLLADAGVQRAYMGL